MTKAIPKIQKYMSEQPEVIQVTATAKEARNRMSELSIRHLPVVDGDGALLGVVSDRDLRLALGLEGADPEKMLVEHVCTQEPYAVSPGDDLNLWWH